MKGSRCRCGYATTSQRRVCPRCGKKMHPSEWPDEGKVISFTRLQVIPEGLKDRYDMALVALEEEGPRVICWTSASLKVDDQVEIAEDKGNMFCVPMEGQHLERGNKVIE